MNEFIEYLPFLFILIIAVPFLLILKQFMQAYIRLKSQEVKLLSLKKLSVNKEKACERMMLFMERMKPVNLIQKFDKELAIHEFIFLTEKTINEEFEYNVSQQLYLSQNLWQNIVDSKLAVIDLLHKTYEGMNGSADLNEFKTVFIVSYMNGDDYIGSVMEDLRRDILIIT